MRIAFGTVLVLAVACLLVAQEPRAVSQVSGATAPQASSSNQSSLSTAATETPTASNTDPAAGAPSEAATAAQPAADSQKPRSTVLPPTPSAHDLAEAKRQFSEGLRLKNSGKTEAAFEKFEKASQLNPRNVEYLTAREFARQKLVMQALERGNKALQEKNEIVATAEFRQALEYDPTNEFARQRLNDSVWEDNPPPSRSLQVVEKSVEISLSPSSDLKDFHFRGDSRTLLTQIARAYGITATIDDSVQTRRVHFDIDRVNFATAMEAASRVTKTFWTALSGSQMYIVSDTAENRRNFERLAVRTYYLPDSTTPQELTEMVSALRVIFDIRSIHQNAAKSTITIKAPLPVVEAATQMIESLTGGRPQLMLEVHVFQVSSSLVRQLGTQLPTQFTLFNIGTLLESLGAGAQSLISQIAASGGLTQANSQAIQALLAQLGQSQLSSLLSTGFVTFGGGRTLTGLSGSPSPTVNFSLNESDVRSLEHATLRASQNTPAVLKVGERYPIVTATFNSVFNFPSLGQGTGAVTPLGQVPAFTYEDLGLNLKVTPIIHSNTDVSLKVELNLRALAGQTVNNIPVIANREYTGSITLKNEESGVVAGLISKADSVSLSGYPFLSRVSAATYATSVHNKNVNDDDLLILMTPHIVQMPSNAGIALKLPVGH